MTLTCCLILCLSAADRDGVREPRYPLKTDRVLYTAKDARQARDNAAAYSSAEGLARNLVKSADTWLDWDDAELRHLLPPAAVPRAFNVGTAGCPTCGGAIYEEGGTYPWVLDLEKPFTVTCPLCKGTFPDNDFDAWYRSGFDDATHLEGEYADNGWGWVGPDGHRYWFVAYANHWTIHSHLVPAMNNLAWAYLLTGDKRYAHKALVLLDRAAEVYPHTDYHNQSRYGQLQEANGSHYGGKLVNLIWATGNLTTMARAYDMVWDTIDGDTALHALTGRNGEQTRAHIEANLLEEGIDAIFAREVRGNFGMHQRALAYAALARQNGPTDEWLGRILTGMGSTTLHTGLNYALYNLVYRDGIPYETSPGYNNTWVRTITTTAEAMKRSGQNLYELPKTKRLYDGVLDLINVGRFTPALGDSGSINGGLTTSAGTFQAAYRAYRDPRYLAHLKALDAVGANSFRNVDSLIYPPLPEDAPAWPPAEPRLLDGYGMAILNNPSDTVSVSLYYGYKGGHGHFDRQHFEIFANDAPIMPDLGYPDFMNGYIPGIYTWSKNTIAHNTVTVDATRQLGNRQGDVQCFATGGFARLVDVDAPETYPQCSTYRRKLVMVDIGPERSYFVDLFDVAGGSQHDYSLHGPPGECIIQGGQWQVQEKGTLAGEGVEIGEIYDDPVRGKKGYTGTYYRYTGSGFQHLFNVKRLESGGWFAEYHHRNEDGGRLRIRMLPPQGTEIIQADAQISPVKYKDLLRYLIARRTGENLESRFAAVIEPYAEEPLIRSVERMELLDNATAVAVSMAGGTTDIVLHNPGRSLVKWPAHDMETDAVTLVARLDTAGALERVWGAMGSYTRFGKHIIESAPMRTGDVTKVEPRECRIHVRMHGAHDEPVDVPAVHFVNANRRTTHPVASCSTEGDELVITTRDDLLVGRAKVTAVEAEAIRTDTNFAFAPVYEGVYLSGAAFAGFHPLTTVAPPGEEAGTLHLAGPLPPGHGIEEGEDVWLVNTAPGDKAEIPLCFAWPKE